SRKDPGRAHAGWIGVVTTPLRAKSVPVGDRAAKPTLVRERRPPGRRREEQQRAAAEDTGSCRREMAGKGGDMRTMLALIKDPLTALVRDEEGASLVEYILLVALIAIVCIAAVTFLGKAAQSRFNFTANAINAS